jgi:acetyl-CoA carboxylase, biotin carboxylase subunit
MFKKVLVANRGEIACRVIRACRTMGIKSVAVFSDADRQAVHVRMADEAYHIGPASSKESYLVGAKILDVAKRSGAEAIHPGYGFLSENADFRRQCEAAGVVFIGPSAEAMELMGEKTLARRTMLAADVAVVPGTADPIETAEEALTIAKEIGVPVMLKAAAGGGGKGMRLVHTLEDVVAGFEAARREAISSFGDDSVYVEKAIIGPRHIEVQVLADSHGNVVYVGDRECSVQRRHQKVIEEAPAPNLSAETRAKMGQLAVQAARAVNYEGAGTVECLVDADENFYFLEMNTRLQVEHCVTEEVFGVDLVQAQLRIAHGEELAWKQEDLVSNGHAIELRLYAEDPYANYLPSPGPLTVYRPPKGPGIRVDDGVEEGAVISSTYDPMIAKLIVSAADRESAIARALVAIAEYEVEGIRTNLDLLTFVLRSAPFASGCYHTGILADLGELPLPTVSSEDESLLRILAVLSLDEERSKGQASESGETGQAVNPWFISKLQSQLRSWSV